MDAQSRLAAAEEALSRADWTEARTRFEHLVAEAPSPEAWEGLGTAAYWLDDGPATFDARHRAFRLYRERGDAGAAARVAIRLSEDYLLFRGESAVANGWILRAERLLTEVDPGPEHVRLLVYKAHYALEVDPDAAGAMAQEAADLARALGHFDLEMLALAVGGVALVHAGAVADGMTRLDEATAAATGGEIRDLEIIPWTCCYLVGTCEVIRDYERAAQWCAIVRDMAHRWNMRVYLATCLPSYAQVLISRGRWVEAEKELTSGEDLIHLTRPAMRPELVTRLAELRRRQGRLAEATDLLRDHQGMPKAMLAMAEIALDRGDLEQAASLAERMIRTVPASARADLAAGYEVLARARAAAGDHAGAMEALQALSGIAERFGTLPLRASTRFAEGVVAAGIGDADGAKVALEEAVVLFERAGTPFEAARARTELAKVLHATGASRLADAELKRAADVMESLGAAVAQRQGRLTGREAEVLRLVARGLTDREVARELALSEHTVHRHVANILSKLGQPSRSAAVAFATREAMI